MLLTVSYKPHRRHLRGQVKLNLRRRDLCSTETSCMDSMPFTRDISECLLLLKFRFVQL